MKKIILFFALLIAQISFGQSEPLPEGLPNSKLSFTINNQSVKIPYWRNLSLGTRRDYITNAIVAFHGINHYGKSIYENLKNAASSEGQLNNTIIIAPIMTEIKHINYYNLDQNVYPYWTTRWKYGDLSQNSNRVSSFTIIDNIIKALVRNNPNLKTLTITGFSAGGQMINRYAAAGRGPNDVPDGIKIQFVSYAPSSYVYLNNLRAIPGSETRFGKPNTNCSNYNRYIYGLESDLNSYLRQTGVTAMRQNFRNRTVYQMVGSNDTSTRFLDVKCGAMLQGAERYQRARIYTNYARAYYLQNNNKNLIVAQGYGHSASAYKASNIRKIFFRSSSSENPCDSVSQWSSNVTYHTGDRVIYNNTLFEYTGSEWNNLGSCSNLQIYSKAPPQNSSVWVYPNPAKDVLHLTSSGSKGVFSIISVNGQILKKGQYRGHPINIDNLQKGVYFITLSENNHQVKTEKFIKL